VLSQQPQPQTQPQTPPQTQPQTPPQTQTPPAEEGANLVGLPIFSSDGEKLGEVVKVGYVKGQRALQAEFGAFLGLGPTPVIIPGTLFEHKGDRIEVAMTAAAIRDSFNNDKNK
jgi:hypothetical protein